MNFSSDPSNHDNMLSHENDITSVDLTDHNSQGDVDVALLVEHGGQKRPLELSPAKSDASKEENNNLKPSSSGMSEGLSDINIKRKRCTESPLDSSEVCLFLYTEA